MLTDKEAKEAIKDRANLVEIVGRNVKLRKSGGSEWVGCCPFHAEKSPSFNVIPGKQFMHCFGCQWHGDVFDYVMKQEGLTFLEALEQLASLTGVELPKRDRRTVDTDARLDKLRAILEEAQGFFEAQLISEEDAMCYLQGRGLTSSFAEKAGLGMAPPTWDMLVLHLKGQGYKDEDIEAAGVGTRGQKGNLLDFMRNRITIPIRDHRGKVVAFGGRILGEGNPKYLNTRDTELFNKGEILYGLDVAKGHLHDGALVVEGYFDVLTLQMLGLPIAVAPMGTALKEAQLDWLKKYTKRITLCLDGDAAGLAAMDKALALALPKGFDVRLLELPAGEDPDTWAARIGGEAFRQLVQRAPDWTSFKVSRAIAKRDMRKTPDRMAALTELAPMLGFLPAETRDAYAATLGHQLQVPVSEVLRAAGVAQEPPKADGAMSTPPKPTRRVLDSALRSLLVSWVANKERVEAVPRSWWHDLQGSDIVEEVMDERPDDWGPDAMAAVEEATTLHAVGHAPVDTLLAFLEVRYVDSQIQVLKQSMGDPSLDQKDVEMVKTELSVMLCRRAGLRRRQPA
jgi:DNA primase